MNEVPIRWRRIRRAAAAAAANAFVKTATPYLQSFGFTPDHVFDIGVCNGTPWLYQAFAERNFVLVDPLAESRAAIAAAGLTIRHSFHEVALSDTSGTLTLNVPKGTRAGQLPLSGFHERADLLKRRMVEVDQREVQVVTLDELAAAYPGNVGLKIDVEGHELAILKGGAATLARAEFVIVEASVTRRFADTVRPSALISHLAQFGLELRDILDTSIPKTAAPRHMDLLFARWQD